MDAVLTLLAKVKLVKTLASNIIEECYRVTVTGTGMSEHIVTACLEVEQFCKALNISAPAFRVNNSSLESADELGDYIKSDNCEWNMILSKDSIVSKLIDGNEFARTKDNILYLSEEAALEWANKIDPFAVTLGDMSPSFEKETVIWLYNSKINFGGKRITVLPVDVSQPIDNDAEIYKLPKRDEINNIVRINSNEMLIIRPETFIVSWGDKTSPLAKCFMLMAVKCLISCICYELKKKPEGYFVTFKGTKSFLGSLDDSCDISLAELQKELIKTVLWIYSERSETRQQLVMDRLSLDMIPENNFFEEIQKNIEVSLQQSQDSYAFVILDRKDAYHKEMRELLKDMRSQADMYASKVRDIVGNVTRDTLGVFAFVGYSFLGKFDKNNLEELLKSHELSLMVKFLAGYLILSFVLQLLIHLRDASLTTRESKKWLSVLQRYTSREENNESFLEPITKRRQTLHFSLFIMSFIYIILALSTWNLPSIALCLLSSK
ncbi:hypothetical protein [Dickeya fangzhongdai]|uniref:hypothetical protein n=1 Tax=Dickeya fangzhongdai TaxID=1778540 RepID=UPI0026DF0320|nr:hypothetical protein [Dickeya fangzhongdai]WKV49538.1 hypothetical protein PL145_16605 [Dickeya fangzhongdai]